MEVSICPKLPELSRLCTVTRCTVKEESCLFIRSALKLPPLCTEDGYGPRGHLSRLLLPSICQSKAALNLNTKLRDPHTALEFRLERALDGNHEDLR